MVLCSYAVSNFLERQTLEKQTNKNECLPLTKYSQDLIHIASNLKQHAIIFTDLQRASRQLLLSLGIAVPPT